MEFLELWFWIEEIHLGRSAALEKVDDALGLSGKGGGMCAREGLGEKAGESG